MDFNKLPKNNNFDNNFNKKKLGKVYGYDGEAGTIISVDGEYEFSKKDISNEVKNNDLVLFNSNILPFGIEKIKVARDIEPAYKSYLKR